MRIDPVPKGERGEVTVIHDIASAAERARVTPEVVRRWIAEGLRATPVGKVGRRGPRDYRIFDDWLLTFLEARSVRAAPVPPPAAPAPPQTPAPRKPTAPPRRSGVRFWPKP